MARNTSGLKQGGDHARPGRPPSGTKELKELALKGREEGMQLLLKQLRDLKKAQKNGKDIKTKEIIEITSFLHNYLEPKSKIDISATDEQGRGLKVVVTSKPGLV